MARGKRKLAEDTSDLNLVPIMNLVVCLIPMVLFGMSLIKVGVVNVTAPGFSPGLEVPGEPPLDLTVAVADDGFRVAARGANVGELLGQPDASVTIPKQGTAYDYVGLYNALVTIKERHPGESVVKLSAERHTPYKYLVGAMDVMRVRLAEDRYDDVDRFRNAAVKYEDEQVALLWPDVVFAVVQ